VYEFADGIFIEESEVRFYGFRIQTRMAVVPLRGRRLLLYSPVSLSPALRAELDRLGTVAFVIPPNKIHNVTLSAYGAAYPQARFYAPPGLSERRPDLAFHDVLTASVDTPWHDEMDCVLTEGNVFFSEALLFHRRSRTLLVGDFVENFTRDTASPLARAVASLWGVRSRPMASPEFRFFTDDVAAASTSLRRTSDWDFERIFLCHGQLVIEDARAVFDQVCDELLEQARARGRLARQVWGTIARFQ
jgi:hypothetical protein